MNERYELVIDTVREVVDRHYLSVPRDMVSLCKAIGIRMMPLSAWLGGGLTEEEFFFLCDGNEDGASALFENRAVTVMYNDLKPRRRIRFTIAEEIMHILLGHVSDEMFMANRHHDPEKYEQYEHEAKAGAGMLLMPPTLYYRYRSLYNLRKLAAMFDMSEAAAYRTVQFYEENEVLVREHCGTYCPQLDTSHYTPDKNVRPADVTVSDEELENI